MAASAEAWWRSAGTRARVDALRKAGLDLGSDDLDLELALREWHQLRPNNQSKLSQVIGAGMQAEQPLREAPKMAAASTAGGREILRRALVALRECEAGLDGLRNYVSDRTAVMAAEAACRQVRAAIMSIDVD